MSSNIWSYLLVLVLALLLQQQTMAAIILPKSAYIVEFKTSLCSPDAASPVEDVFKAFLKSKNLTDAVTIVYMYDSPIYCGTSIRTAPLNMNKIRTSFPGYSRDYPVTTSGPTSGTPITVSATTDTKLV
ncbi:hypothetical protein BDF22DRAFT_746620 [Syncephalis plumigaleata]|nr:hypothetical protein BDF22DRAFT_746620 [Syncephalis plumigaleata]